MAGSGIDVKSNTALVPVYPASGTPLESARVNVNVADSATLVPDGATNIGCIITIITAALVPVAFANEAKTEIDSNDQMQYDKKTFEVVEGQEVTLTLTHSGQLPKVAMGHNVVILKPGTNLAEYAMKCAPAAANDYIPEDEESKALIIAHTKMLGGGEKDNITFTAPAAGEYPFFCSFPGHFALMQGVMTVVAK